MVDVLKDWWPLWAWYKQLDIPTIIFPNQTFQKQLLEVLQDSPKTIFLQIWWKLFLVKSDWKIGRKLKRLSILTNIFKCITSNYMGKRDCNISHMFCLHGGRRLKLRHDLDGCPLHFWSSEWHNSTVKLLHATCTRFKKMTTNDRSLTFFALKQANQRL